MDIQHLTIEIVKQIKGDLLDKIDSLEQRIAELESKNNLQKRMGGSIIEKESSIENKQDIDMDHSVEKESSIENKQEVEMDHSAEKELTVQNKTSELGGYITW